MRRTLQDLKNGLKMTDNSLRAEESTHLQKKLVTTIRPALKARKFFSELYSGEELGEGISSYSYDTISEMSAADVVAHFINPNLDVQNISRTTVDIPIVLKGYLLPRGEVAAARKEGRDLKSSYLAAASYRAAKAMNDIVVLGWTLDGGSTYEVDGFYGGAGNSYTSAADFATAGKAIVATSAGVGLLTADDVDGPYKLGLNAIQATQLNASVLSSGLKEKDVVREILVDELDDLPTRGGTGKGMIARLNSIAAGTGLMYGQAPDHAMVLRGKDPVNENWPFNPIGTAGMVWGSHLPVIIDSDLFCSMTTI